MTTAKTVSLPAGVMEYYDTGGSGPAIVLLHGVLMDHTLWNTVVEQFSGDYRCVIPVLPLGAHRIAMPEDADLSPTGVADLIADFLTTLGLSQATVVGNDTGGALAQLLAVRHPELIGCLVLVSCDAFDNFPPGLPGRVMALLCKMPGALTIAMRSLRLAPLRRLPMTFGQMTKRPIDRETFDGWLDNYFADRAVRRDIRKVMRRVNSHDLVAAAEQLQGFAAPTLIAWAAEDKVMPVEHAWRLAERLSDARVELIADTYTLVPLDQPRRLARLIDQHVAAGVGGEQA